MTDATTQGGWLMLLTSGVALALMVLPMPFGLEMLRPQWVALLTLYWCLMVPDRFGVFSAFALGLALDLMLGSLLGQHALSLSLLAYAAVMLHQRVRVFPIWQQAVFVWLLLVTERLINLWVLAATATPLPAWDDWISTLIGFLLWPWLFFVMSDLARRAGLV